MRKCYGGQRVKGGRYLNCTTWDYHYVPKEGGVLPGPPGLMYRHMAPVEMVVGGVILGGSVLLFVSLLGWIGLLYQIFVWGAFFVGQKVMAFLVWGVCRSEGRFCHTIHIYLWGQCGKTVTDDKNENIRMGVLAFFLMFFVLLLIWATFRYHVFG